MSEPNPEITITLEGFVDRPSDSECYILMVKPIYQLDHLDTSGVDQVVEDYAIAVCLGEEPEPEPSDSKVLRRVRNAFYKVRKKNTYNRTYWKRVVKIYPGDEEKVFDILESVGD